MTTPLQDQKVTDLCSRLGCPGDFVVVDDLVEEAVVVVGMKKGRARVARIDVAGELTSYEKVG